jgi:hypothetical protein
MRRIGKILCPLGSSEYSLKACEYPLSLAQRDGAKHFLQHLVQPPPFTCPCYAFPDPINEVFRNLETSVGQEGFADDFLQTRRWRAGGICESLCPKPLN